MKGRSHFEAGCYANQDLWASDLRTKQIWPVLPGFPMVAYSVSPDEQYAVCSVAASTGKTHLWIASLDHRSAPEQIKTSFSESGDQPTFTPDGNVLFRGTRGESSYLYRWKAMGKVVETVTRDAIIELQSISPDGRWAIAQVALSGSESPQILMSHADGAF
jgi:Tol biopolymer transport system component